MALKEYSHTLHFEQCWFDNPLLVEQRIDDEYSVHWLMNEKNIPAHWLRRVLVTSEIERRGLPMSL